MRDLMNDSFSKIVTDNSISRRFKAYIQEHAPEQISILDKHNDKAPLFEQFRYKPANKTTFGKTVTLKSGAYVILEHTKYSSYN